MTPKMYAMLVAANGCSLPGDGLRIKGSGEHVTARALERLGFVRVAIPSDNRKARVHVTRAGRSERERRGQEEIRAMLVPSMISIVPSSEEE